MIMANEATLTRNPLEATLYSDRKIENTTNGINSLAYPTNDWREQMFKDYTMNQRANMSLSGGGGVARYFVSGAFNQDNGLMEVDKRNYFKNGRAAWWERVCQYVENSVVGVSVKKKRKKK